MKRHGVFKPEDLDFDVGLPDFDFFFTEKNSIWEKLIKGWSQQSPTFFPLEMVKKHGASEATESHLNEQ